MVREAAGLPRGGMSLGTRDTCFNYFGSLLGVLGPWRDAYYRCVKFSLWETLCSLSYNHFQISCWRPKCKFSLMKLWCFGCMVISRPNFWSSIVAMCMRNRTMGIPAPEDGFFVNLLIFDCLYTEIGGAGYRSIDRESCSYELTLVVGHSKGNRFMKRQN